MSRLYCVLTPVSLLLLSGCAWFTDFKQQPKIDPWESSSDTIPFRGNPQFSVPIYGSAAPGFEYSRAQLPATIDSMSAIPNPVPADARSVENGRKYFQINCAPCHGEAGLGNGAVTKFGFPGINIGSASSLAATKYTDGYIFGMIRNGRGMMPTYNRIEEPDRWDIVNYLRALQGKIAIPAVAAPTGRPGETGPQVPGVTQMGPTRPAPYYKRVGAQAGVTLGPDDRARAVAGPAPALPNAATEPSAAPNAQAGEKPAPGAQTGGAPAPGTAPKPDSARKPDSTRPASRVPRPGRP